jgi:hypothetical protein
MFSIMSATELKTVNWSVIEGIHVGQAEVMDSKRGEKRPLDVDKDEDIHTRCAIGELCFNDTVSSLNPEHHSIYLNTFPRFREFETNTSVSTITEKEKETDALTATITTAPTALTALTATQFYDKFVKRTQEECDEERSAKQGSKEWLEVRKLSLTASVFGAAAGSNPYQSPQDLLEEKLWGTFNGNALTVWGNEHEPHARESFLKWFKEFLSARYFFAGRADSDNPIFELKEDNAIKFSAEPWLAVSPDGILYYEDADGTKKVSLVEFKCPTRDNAANPLASPYAKYENCLPSYYKDQVQGICGYLNDNKYLTLGTIDDIWFVVWRPSKTWITHLKADSTYYTKILKPKLFSWYFKLYLPALTRKYNAGGERSKAETLQL